ncbi:MAG: sigma-54-dependent Fis family transcriptional regulator [Betaproteobacteria bacterium]|nr:sigma-54-dependent Fis family transcriptional regulator [Betaproteobacteria bacterium]
MKSTADILIIDDEPDLRELYLLSLVHEGYVCDAVGSVREALAALQAHSYGALIVDMRLPDGSGLDILRHIQTAQRSERVIVATAYGSADNAVEALKAGAFDYLSKPVDVRQLRLVVRSALQGPGTAGQAAAGASAAAPQSAFLQRLVGSSPSMVKLRDFIRRVAPSMAPVLVRGESGTGKELIARAIHELSPRAVGPFVAVNCGAIPSELLEAEFFGYRKGAFTGANTDREGFFQAAAGGTLFLDEVAELPMAMQAKLLRALQERRVRMLGDTTELPVDVRVVSATHQNLMRMVEQGSFRQDLFYRLNVIELPVPSLRERASDVGLLASHVLERLSNEAGRRMNLADDALAALQRYNYPGNVRELENLLQRAVALATDTTLRASDLAFNTLEAIGQQAPAVEAREREFLPSDIGVYIDAVERDILERALEKTQYNRTAAAQLLGLSLRQIRYRMSRLGIRDDDGSGAS